MFSVYILEGSWVGIRGVISHLIWHTITVILVSVCHCFEALHSAPLLHVGALPSQSFV